MTMPDSPAVVLYDASGQVVSQSWAPVSNRPGQALYKDSSGNLAQGGVVALGHDYGTSATVGTAYAPKIDSTGAQYMQGTSKVQCGQALTSNTAFKSDVMQGLNGLTPTAVAVDSLGQIASTPAALPTFSVYAAAVSVANGKSLISLMNKSSSSVLRLVAAYAQNTATNPSALNTYYIFAEEAHLITGASGGTSLTAIAYDTADSLASGVTAATGATVSGEVSPAFRRWISSNYPLAPGSTTAENTTSDEQGRFPWVTRPDSSCKPITIRPGYGFHIKAASTATNGVQDLTLIFTQASA